MTPELLVTISLHGLSGLVLLASGLFVLLHNPKRSANRLLFLNFLAIAVYELGMVLGPLMSTYELAYQVWFTNIVDVFIAIAAAMFMLTLVGQEKKYRLYIYAVAAIGFGIFFTALLAPEAFLPQVEPKLYFPWYLDAGWLYFVMVGFFILAPLFPCLIMIREYFRGFDQRRVEYIIVMYAIGYTLGCLNFALVFDIPIDPLYGSPIGLGLIPLAYGIIADQLLDIRVVFKRALIYSVWVGLLSGILALFIFLNDLLVDTVPWVQFWTIPVFTSIIALIIGRIVWSKVSENDRLKYEFITVAAHKFRTPLTQISLSTQSLAEMKLSPEALQFVEQIRHANTRLIELTNTFFETTQEGVRQYDASKVSVGLLATTRAILEKRSGIVEKKKLRVSIHADDEVYVAADPRRISSVIEVLIENAITYTPEGGLVQVIAYRKGNRAMYSVRDSGIGVLPNERHLIFSRFYRTDEARRVDTEGIGLGLAMAKSIIEKHRGTMGVESHGRNKGSLFWFSLPVDMHRAK